MNSRLPMHEVLKQNRLALASLICLLVSWLLLWLLIGSGMNSHRNTWWLNIWSISSIFSAPLAVLIAIAGLVFDRSKKPASIALLVSVISTLVILSIGG
jgi:hypothetical protein